MIKKQKNKGGNILEKLETEDYKAPDWLLFNERKTHPVVKLRKGAYPSSRKGQQNQTNLRTITFKLHYLEVERVNELIMFGEFSTFSEAMRHMIRIYLDFRGITNTEKEER